MIYKAKQYLFGNAPVFGYMDERTYTVVECDKMVSCIGMEIKGKPKINKPSIITKDREYRTLTILKIEDFKGGFIAHTKHLTLKFLEI